jgi:hypothetical protein
MQLRNVGFLFVLLAGAALAQDTNFSTGPQYLITSSSPILLHSISTPTLSLGEAQPAASGITPTEISTTSEAPAPFIPASQTFFGDVYWGAHPPDQVEGRRIETPSLSLSPSESPEVTTAESESAAPPSAEPGPRVMEITSAVFPPNLPPSIVNTGVTGLTDPQALRDRGYGVSLGEFAAYQKTHRKKGARVLTNEDLERH